MCVFLLSTYTDGEAPDSATWFTRWVAETASDFRVHKSLLRNVNYAVFALGNSLFTQHYNTAGRELFHNLQLLSAKPVYPLGLGDEDVAQSKFGGALRNTEFCGQSLPQYNFLSMYCIGIEEDFMAWWMGLKALILPVLSGSSPPGSLDAGCEKTVFNSGSLEDNVRPRGT